MVRIAWSALLLVPWLCPISTHGAPASASQPATAAVAKPLEMLPAAVPVAHPVSRDKGYRGIWWCDGKPGPSPVDRLSGGLATEPMDHTPVAQYAAAVDRTFFVYVGTDGAPVNPEGKQPARIMVSYYDHKTGTVPAPVILVDKLPLGAHGCPALSMDAEGRLWVFVSILGAEHPSTIFRSAKPYQIDAWEKVTEMDFQQPQAWYLTGKGFMLVHCRKVEGKLRPHFAVSPDGLSWSKPVMLAAFGEDQNCLSGRYKNKIGIVFRSRQGEPSTQLRTDLYYVETPDFGRTWQVYPRSKIELPITAPKSPSAVYGQKNWRFLLRDLAFDGMGNPVIFYLVTHVRKPMAWPESRIWTTTRWAGREWETNGAMLSDSDFDAGCLDVEKLVWTATIPLLPGPEPKSPGGEILRCRSEDQGLSWYPLRLAPGSTLNQNWIRRVVDSREGFKVFWADGDPNAPSESRLCFADAAGNVYALPAVMNADTAKPELVHQAPAPKTQPGENTGEPGPTVTQPAGQVK